MESEAIETSADLPAGFWPEVTVRFFPDHSSRHPLWFWFDHPDIADLHLPTDLADRLKRWSSYWDNSFHWEDGWPAGAPESWWTEEEMSLPRDVALALGSDFIIEVEGRYLHSTCSAESLESAAAVHALVEAEIAEQQQIRTNIAAGAKYDFVAGDTSYRAWLAEHPSDEYPTNRPGSRRT